MKRLLLLLGLALYLPGLAHESFWNWDEAVHAAAARGAFESFFNPHVLAHPIYPVSNTDWINSSIWLHKPPLPFWLSAVLMHLIGVTPLALRLVSLAGLLTATLCLFELLRGQVSRRWATLVCATFLLLPFNWRLVQGYQFGDVTDCALLGFATLSILLLARRRNPRLVGGTMGAAFLCKSALALAPLGVALALVGLRKLRPAQFVQIVLAFLIVALPWQIACALRFPELNRVELLHTFGHLSGAGLAQWIRPWDAVFNQLHDESLAPLPHALTLIAGAYLLFVKRRVARIAALWLWGEWIVCTFCVAAKAPALVWGASPALFFAIAVALRDAWRKPLLAAALTGALVAPLLLPHLAFVRAGLPAMFVQTRARPGLAEGLSCALVFLPLARLRPAPIATLLALFFFFVRVPRALSEEHAARRIDALAGMGREAGVALDENAPKDSVIFLALDRDPPHQFPTHELMFWSGRTTYRRAPDLPAAQAAHLHPYLVSPRDEPFREVPGVPASASLRAYDLLEPERLHPPPPGVTPLFASLGSTRVLGFASRGERYVFYLEGPPARGVVVFRTDDGEVRARLDSANALAAPNDSWLIVPVLGPPQPAHVEVQR
jgi:hypothetical protein